MTDSTRTRTPDGTEPERLHSLRGRAEAALSRGSVSLQGLDAQAFETEYGDEDAADKTLPEEPVA